LDSVALKVVKKLIEVAPRGACDVMAMVPQEEGGIDPLAEVIK
jgi:hypothetical protein